MLYTLEEAAKAIAGQLGWHTGAQSSLLKDMTDAANAGKMSVRNPHTDVPVSTRSVHTYYELVTPDDVNKWAAKKGLTWRWTAPALDKADASKRPSPKPRRGKRRTWRDVALPYVVETYCSGKYTKARVFYVALVNKAGAKDSPFDVLNRELLVKETRQSVTQKTIENAMPEIKAAALIVRT